MIRKIFFVFIILFNFPAIAQNIRGKIIDSKTGESIPYANILINQSENLISNEDGYFSLSESNGDDLVLTISYLGYVNHQLTIAQLKKQQNIIKLESGVFELTAVDVSNAKPNAYSIMATVKKNLERNYKNEAQPTKELLFFREVNSFNPEIMNLEITESSGFTKNTLKVANNDLNTFSSNLISHPPKDFTDILSYYYNSSKMDINNPVKPTKLDVVKATKLKDENRSTNVDDMEQTVSKMLLQHLDSTKYYRVKSGLFGARDSISLRKDFYKKKRKKGSTTQLSSFKSSLNSFISKNNFANSTKLDFVNHYEIYEFEYDGAIYSNANEFVYVLKFKPKKSKAKYTGTLYISETDYAVIRADYTLAEGKTVSGFNMKLLLGIKSSENVSKGTVIYNRNTNGIGYYLRYALIEKGYSFYINRPIKFIELTRAEKDVLALDLKVKGSTLQKRELLNIKRTEITNSAFEAIEEKNFKFTNLKRYDPRLWKDISTIEPLEEMKHFKSTE
jgi:hypothetical protein